MARYEFDETPMTPNPAGGTARSRGKPGPATKGKSASKRKPTRTHPGHRRAAAGETFETESWHSVPKETSGKSPRAVQAKHPPKAPRRKGKPTLH